MFSTVNNSIQHYNKINTSVDRCMDCELEISESAMQMLLIKIQLKDSYTRKLYFNSKTNHIKFMI